MSDARVPVQPEILDACKASEPDALRRRILDPNLPKNEAEHWASAEITRLTARIAELEKALTWQPIDTAPKDGTWIMGWASGDLNPSRISWGRNYNNNLSWCTAFCSFVEGYITHWTPLPRTTLEASERGGGE